jgi:hypothetical protein
MTNMSKKGWVPLPSTSIVNLMVGLTLVRLRNYCNLAGPCGHTTEVSSKHLSHLAALWSAVSSVISTKHSINTVYY